jgi:broad specificity phosphatase PhoE
VRFVLVLHGETAPGPEGPALTETGRLQAQAVAAELQGTNATVLTSPSPDALQAAALIAASVGVGAPEPRTELDAPADEAAYAAAQEAAWAIIETAKTTLDPDATLVLVTHEPTIRLLVCRALNMPLSEQSRFALTPGSTSTIEWRTQPRERLLIASLNEVCHLEPSA